MTLLNKSIIIWPVRDSLPLGYSIEYDGSKESSIKASHFISQPVPLMLISIMILLMIQLQNIPKMILTLLTGSPRHYRCFHWFIADRTANGLCCSAGYSGISWNYLRNSVILMDQIDQQQAAGETLWDAIINATMIRFRPILLTAAAAILGMIPLVSSIFGDRWLSPSPAVYSVLPY